MVEWEELDVLHLAEALLLGAVSGEFQRCQDIWLVLHTRMLRIEQGLEEFHLRRDQVCFSEHEEVRILTEWQRLAETGSDETVEQDLSLRRENVQVLWAEWERQVQGCEEKRERLLQLSDQYITEMACVACSAEQTEGSEPAKQRYQEKYALCTEELYTVSVQETELRTLGKRFLWVRDGLARQYPALKLMENFG